ncbi:MAG: hypothetical protein JXA99_10985 [Candidatus Lokiarchaeota archaeon]|nr:hypothetical protein [Candidatus Lokiarchaeota archaeon]
MAKDLKDMIDGIEDSEQKLSRLEAKVDRLTELTNRQKKVISEQEQIIEVYKEKITSDMDIPPDIVELKELIGAQRAQLKEKDMEIEYLKGAKAQVDKELELIKKQIKPLEEKYSDSFETIGQLKADMITKDGKVKEYEAKIVELKTFSEKLKTDYQNEFKAIREKSQEEIDDLKSKINELESVLLDSKLISTEKSSEAKDFATRFKEIKEKSEDFISKIESLHDQNREKDAKIRELEQNSIELKKFKDENFDKVSQYEKLTSLMEGEPQFKAFLIIKDVGGRGLSIEDLKKSLGSPIVMVKKFVDTLKSHQLIEENENGKLIVKKVN